MLQILELESKWFKSKWFKSKWFMCYDGKLKSYNWVSLGLVFSGNKQESFQQKFMLVFKIEKISDIFSHFQMFVYFVLKDI